VQNNQKLYLTPKACHFSLVFVEYPSLLDQFLLHSQIYGFLLTFYQYFFHLFLSKLQAPVHGEHLLNLMEAE